jgi:trehalose-6-phosphate synthase
MRAMRRRVYEHDVAYWAHTFLEALEKPPPSDPMPPGAPPPDTPPADSH